MQEIFPECHVSKFRPFAHICTSRTVFPRYFTKRGRKCLAKEVNLHICLYSKHAFINLRCVHFCLLNIILFVTLFFVNEVSHQYINSLLSYILPTWNYKQKAITCQEILLWKFIELGMPLMKKYQKTKKTEISFVTRPLTS